MNIYICGDRGTGKTTRMTEMVTEECLKTPNTEAILVLGTLDHIQYVRELCTRDKQTIRMILGSESIIFHNGSTIRLMGTNNNFRGLEPDLVGIDCPDYMKWDMREAFRNVKLKIITAWEAD